MHRTKLIETLRALDTRERTRWRQYVQADFFNKHKHVRALAGIILDYAPDFSHEQLEKRFTYSRVFGSDAPYDELKFNNLISDLYELLLGFLGYLQYESEPLEGQFHRLNALLDRNLDAMAGSVLSKTRLLLDRIPEQTARRQQFELRWWEAAEMLDSRQARRIAGEHLHRQASAIDVAFVLEKLRLGAAQLSRQGLAVVQSEERPNWLEEIRRWCVDARFLSQLPAVQVYLAVLDLLEHPSPDTFAAITDLLDEHYLVFSRDELTALYQYALNYCIRRINEGHPDAYPQVLGLYRILLDRHVLIRHGKLSQWTYKNITTAGLRSGAFAWTEQFLYEYRDALLPGERENAFAYNLAALLYEKKDYATALMTLQNVEFTDFTYHLGAKIMQLKCFYLLQEIEALTALLEATQQLLRRNRSLSAFGKTANLNFLGVLRHLSAWKQREDISGTVKREQQRTNLLEKVKNLHPLANKDWLVDMLHD